MVIDSTVLDPGGEKMPVLEVQGLVKTFGRRRVVNGVDFAVDRGEIVGPVSYTHLALPTILLV